MPKLRRPIDKLRCCVCASSVTAQEGIRQADSAEHQVTNDRARIHQVKHTLDYDTDPQYASQLSVCSSNKDVQ